MTTERRFCRFSGSPKTAPFNMTEIPSDGFCLSAFLVLASNEHPGRILMGQLNPSAPWDHLGALDPERVEAWKGRWMLPASHLLYREGPDEAARRVLEELTGLAPRPLLGPTVTSEVYGPSRHPQMVRHWDLGFVYRGSASEGEIQPHKAWSSLAFVDLGSVTPAEMARSHDDILAQVGLPIRTSAPA